MKITDNVSNNITLYSGMKSEGESNQLRAGKDDGGTKKSIYAGALNEDLLQNRILQRRKEAQEKAMKVIGEVFSGDLAIDEDMQARREHVRELQDENKKLQADIKAASEEQERLKEEYGITEDSEEQLELNLVMKNRNKMTKGSLTPEERMQAAAVEARGLTEYQQRYLELEETKTACQETYASNGRAIREENAIIRETKMERLKHSPMVKAQNQAEDIMEAASEEIKGMVVEDAKEHVDEAAEEREEKGEKIEEKREEQEEFIERQQEKNREQEELLEEIPMEEMLSMSQTQEDIQKEVQQIVDKMKLVAEDIKGAAVDQTV